MRSGPASTSASGRRCGAGRRLVSIRGRECACLRSSASGASGCFARRDAEIGLRIGESFDDGGIGIVAAPRVELSKFAARSFFESRAQLAILNVSREASRLRLPSFLTVSAKFFSSSAMRLRWRSTHSARSARRSASSSAMLGARLALRIFDFIAAAMQIGDQLARLARFGRDRALGAFDHLFRQAQAPRDGDAARNARHADEQAIGGRRSFLVEFHRGVEDAGRRRGVGFQAIVMRGGERQAAARAEFIEERDGQRGAFFGRGARAHFVDEHERCAAWRVRAWISD